MSTRVGSLRLILVALSGGHLLGAESLRHILMAVAGGSCWLVGSKVIED